MHSKRTTLNTLLSSCCFLAAAVMASQSASAVVYTVTTGNTTVEPTLLSGTGDVEVTGGGTLQLTNTGNTYSGGTLAYGGSTLLINNNGELGAAAGTLTLGDNATTATTGTLKFGAATTLPSTRSITLAAGGGSIDTGTFANTIAGVISGTGALTTLGTGTLTLSGVNTYTGATTISAGSTLSLSGSIATSSKVANNGTFAITANASIISLSGSGNVTLGSKTLTLTNPADTFSGVISGTGGLTMALSTGIITGSETLTGVNTYTGTTTVGAGSTLYLSGTGSIATSSSISLAAANSTTGAAAGTFDISGASGAVSVKNVTSAGNVNLGVNTLTLTAASGTYSGIMSGTGGLTIGTGTLIMSGANTFTGTTTISTGTTLTVGASTKGALASTSIVDNGSLIFARTDSLTIAGVISGTGSITQNAGSGVTVLSGNNTYTGTTTVTSGTLQIGSGGTTGWVPTATIANSGTVAFSRSDNVVFSGAITGTGGLLQMGGGTLTLTGANTFTGNTQITGGTLQVGDDAHTSVVLPGNVVVSGGTLSGRGTVTGAVTNITGGKVNTGGSIGTLTVGSYSQATGSSLLAEVAPTGASLLNVTGAAAISGGTVAVTVDSGNYTEHYYPILKASSITGAFTAVTGGESSAYAVGVYAPSSAEVDLVVAPKAAGQIYGDIVTASLDTATTLNDIAVDHAAFESCTVPGGTKGSNCHGLSFWARGIGGTGHTNDGDGAAGFNTTTWGAIVGVDYRFSDEGSLHLTGAHTSGKVSVAGGGASADTDDWFVSVGGHASGPIIALDADAFYASDSANVTRTTALSNVIQSNVKNIIGGFTFQASVPLLGGDLVPLARVTYGFLTYGSFSESGSATFDLSGAHDKQTAGLYDFGVRVSHDFSTSGGIVLRPSLYVAVEDNGTISSPGVTVSMASSFGNTFVAPSVTPKRISGVVRAGLDAKLDDAWSLQAGFGGRMSGNQKQGLFTLGTTFRF